MALDGAMTKVTCCHLDILSFSLATSRICVFLVPVVYFGIWEL